MPERNTRGYHTQSLTLSTAVESTPPVSACLWASPEAVFFVACLLSTGEPMRLSFSFFSDYSAFEHRTPPSSHHPNSTFQLRDLMVPGISPLPCRQTARWLSLRNRLQRKLSTEEQDALCIFLRPGIQIPFRGCICLKAP